MSPKASIPLDSILEAGLELLREGGRAKLSARALASRLGTSTMPLYSSLGSMEELERLLRDRVAKDIAEYQARSWSSNPLLDAAIGYVRFARDEPALFKFLWEPAPSSQRLSLEGLAERNLEGAGEEQPRGGEPEQLRLLAAFSRDEKKRFEFHVWIFVHGIASLAAEGIIELDDESLIAHLEAAGAAFYLYHAQQGQAEQDSAPGA